MNTIQVKASKNYPVYIGSGLLSSLGTYATTIPKAKKAIIISDNVVWDLYGSAAENSLVDIDITVDHYVFQAGESSKNADTYLSILNFLAENQITRTDILIALGGGVVGDITGFVAATYLRGIPYIQIPTTLLAMVDSSVGGKTAIDLPAGKNLVGAFYQPNFVLCDTDTLNSLPIDIFRDGCAEVIKYGVLYDADLFQHLQEHGLAFDREAVISRCVALKRDVVAADEFDIGQRQKLNLGHTIGHGIEAQSNFTISHGKAVAIGMAIVAKAGSVAKICDADTYNRIIDTLDIFGLPKYTSYTAETLSQSALSDKKRTGDAINLIIPERIGSCIIHGININELLPFIKAGL